MTFVFLFLFLFFFFFFFFFFLLLLLLLLLLMLMLFSRQPTLRFLWSVHPSWLEDHLSVLCRWPAASCEEPWAVQVTLSSFSEKFFWLRFVSLCPYFGLLGCVGYVLVVYRFLWLLVFCFCLPVFFVCLLSSRFPGATGAIRSKLSSHQRVFK